MPLNGFMPTLPPPRPAPLRRNSQPVNDQPVRSSLSTAATHHVSRPTLPKRHTFANMLPHPERMRPASFISMYANFAGERLDSSREQVCFEASDINEEDPGLYPLEKDDLHVKMAQSQEIALQNTAGDNARQASVGKAMFTFLKAFIGSGVLFLPKAFESGGWALSIFLMMLVACICLFAILRLVATQQVIGGSYGDVGKILYGQSVRYTVLFFIVISQIGFVCAYFIFVSGNLVNVVSVLSKCAVHIEQKYYIWMPLVVIIPLVLIRHIAQLSIAAIVANIFILFGLLCVIYFTGSQLHQFGLGPNITAINPSHFGLTIGTATFSFEGIGLVVPIVQSMKEPHKFSLVTAVGVSIVCFIYILIGLISYLAYGTNIKAAVVYNLPPDNGLTIAVQLLYSVAIVLTAPLMLFPALRIIENGLFRRCQSGSESITVKWTKNIYRIVLACVCAAISFAIGGDNLDKFVSLVGSVACVPLCFIFPGLFHYKIAETRKDLILDAALVVWGVGIMIYTMFITISTMIHPVPDESAIVPYCPA